MQQPNFLEFIYTLFFGDQPSSFKNECETQLKLHSETGFSLTTIDWIGSFKLDTSHKSNEISNGHREEGNRLFRANKKLNALAAGRCYTNAILSAPDGSRALSLAHANRSAAIAEFGYYKEAFEDCQCAIDYGYPDENLQKIIIRQAYCANKLKDHNKLKACVEKLRTMSLSEPFAKQKAEFEQELANINDGNRLNGSTDQKMIKMDQNIVVHPQNGRSMTASEDIDKGENIFIEKVFSLVPVGDAKICSNCAAQKIIPFPCNVCSKIYYCSLKCKRSHEMVHRFECYAYRCGILAAIGISHLALNTLINGLPSIIPSLQKCTSHLSIWKQIETIAKSGDGGYADVLSLITNMDSMEWENLRMYSISAGILTYYLKKFTAFYTLFDSCAASIFDWDIIVSALLLRHCTQMICNANSALTLTCLEYSYEFHALTDIWSRPQHLKKELLFMFSKMTVQQAGINPYFSICNHSCAPSLTTKFDGEYVTAIARHPIRKGAEIFNGYVADYRHEIRSMRQLSLKSIYHFDCVCEYCRSNSDDSEFFKFHKYRCQSSKCKAIFSPPRESLRFWEDNDRKISFFTCPECGTKLSLEWYWLLLRLSEDPTRLPEILRIIHDTERTLVGMNEPRQRISMIAVEVFFTSWKFRGLPVSRDESIDIAKILSYSLNVCEERHDVESLAYAAMATYALDLMAQGIFLDFDCKKINESLKMLSTELKIVFENYIEDYIGDKFKISKVID